jgi:hypothetical protein
MNRRRFVAGIATSAVLAAMAALGVGHASAEWTPPGGSPSGPRYASCAEGGLTSYSVTGSTLAFQATATICQSPLGLPANQFAFELRGYTGDSGRLLRRFAYASWTEPTSVTSSVWLEDDLRAVCLTVDPHTGRHMQCLRLTPPAAAGGAWTAAPLPVDDPMLDVPELNTLPPNIETPDPNCGSCL